MDDGAALDLLFIQDATGSMGDYIRSAKNNIVEICKIILASGRLRAHEGLQVGLLAYRDYPLEENEFIVKEYPFTFDVDKMEGYLDPLEAKGGNDRPEAFSTALEYAYASMKGWRDDALKAIVVVTDAPPHGINEKGDSFPKGSPEGVTIRDPLELTRAMADEGYSIFMLACEPTLAKTNEYAIDFYRAISNLSLGAFVSLTDSKLLAACLIGSLLERIDLSILCGKYQEDIARRVLQDGLTVDEVIDEFQSKLAAEGQKITTLQSGNIYNDLAPARENYDAFLRSASLADARKDLKRVYTQRVNANCARVIRSSSEAGGTAFSSVSIRFRNLGAARIALQFYDAELRRMFEDMVLPNNFTTVKTFNINIPVNFVLQSGRETKNFSRTFNKEQDIDVDQIFNNS